ncbi:MAG TPA: hypothetical protein VJJ48_00360, partial [Candidatus Paceibacterota bacterium]
MDNIENLVKDRLEKLPPEVATAIRTVPWIEKMEEIARAHKLDEDKTEAFGIETALVIVGVEPPQNYPENLAEKVGLDEDMVVEIAREVDEKILTPILELVKNPKLEEKAEKNSANLPMIEPNEVVHDVKPQETQNKVEIKIQEEPPVKDKPDPRNENYQAGKDPYLEPL